MTAPSSTRSGSWSSCWPATTAGLVDIPVGDQEAARVLREVFGFHPLAVQAGVERNAVPKVRASRDHLFVILHAPELGTGGHVHYVELDQFIGPRYLITVHGPVNPAVTPEATLRETRAVLGRIQAGRLRPPVGVRAVRCHRLGPGPGPGGVRGDRDPPGVAAGAAGHLRPPG
jgi:hypothetical protein